MAKSAEEAAFVGYLAEVYKPNPYMAAEVLESILKKALFSEARNGY